MSQAQGFRMPGVAVATAVVWLTLDAIRQLLSVPSGYDIESMLGWTDKGAIAAIVEIWERPFRAWAVPLAEVYLVVDTVLFMPLYGLLLLALWRNTSNALARHSSRPSSWASWVLWAGVGLLAVLLACDGLENINGLNLLLEHGDPWRSWLTAGVVAALACGGVFGLHRKVDPSWAQSLLPPGGVGQSKHLIGLLLVPVTLIPLMCWKRQSIEATCGGLVDLSVAACYAHHLKPVLLLPLLGVPAALGFWVLFGPHADDKKWGHFVQLRRGLLSVLARSRYVLIALAAAAALLVALDQGRDVIYAVASHPWTGSGQDNALRCTFTVLALGATAVAVWMLGFACWLWARVVLQVRPRQSSESKDPSPVTSTARDQPLGALARNWARLVGVAPALLVIVLTLQTLPGAANLGDPLPIAVLVAFAAVVTVVMVVFIWRRDTALTSSAADGGGRPLGYFDASDGEGVFAQFTDKRFRLFGLIPPVHMPLLAIVLALSLRTLAARFGGEIPSLALPIVLLNVTFWLSLAGWLSVLEQEEAVPWYLFIAVAIGALGLLGLTENHRVTSLASGLPLQTLPSLVPSAVLAAIVLVCFYVLKHQMTKPDSQGSTKGWTGPQVVSWLTSFCAIFVVLLVLSWFDRRTPAPMAQGGTASKSATVVVKPEVALADWLKRLAKHSHDSGQQAAASSPAYLIAAEGGGIRSAYWTALVLSELARHQTELELRTFAMVGVSGGSVGLAAFRACTVQAHGQSEPQGIDHDRLVECVHRLGRADLLTPLAGAWFFEDVIGRIVPSVLCNSPGCGFMSRGLWFEQGLIDAMQSDFGEGLVAMRDRRLKQRRGLHTPYLMLNATWVEAGERSIASEMAIDWHRFPGARDQLATLGVDDLPLASAAHNSARFPFTNALGAVQTTPSLCTPDAYLFRLGERSSSDKDERPERCGHLADGGYFDNAGAHTVADLVRLLRACLDLRDELPAACPGVGIEDRTLLAKVLDLRVVFIRNGVDALSGSSVRTECRAPARPTEFDVQLPAERTDSDKANLLRRPECAGSATLYADLLGPAITAFNAIGTGSGGRLAASRPVDEADELARRFRQSAPAVPQTTFVDLRNDGPLFPLGWHLSPSIQAEMAERAGRLKWQ